MHHILNSLLPCRSQLQRAAVSAAGRISNLEPPQISFLVSERAMIAPRAMHTTSINSYSSSDTPKQQPETNAPKPDTPDDVAPEIEKGAAPMNLNPDEFNAREGGEGGPGKIPLKNEQVKEEIRSGSQGEGEAKRSDGGGGGDGGEGGKQQKGVASGKQEDQQDGSMGPDSVGDTHRLDYSR